MSVDATSFPTPAPKPDWYPATARYGRSDAARAAWQLANTLAPYVALWALMIHLIQRGWPYWITLALAAVAGGFLVRLFILFHDCCHGAFFDSRRANTLTGNLLGVLTFTPFAEWRRLHGIHHSAAGDLDRRGSGDIWTLTVEEYRAASRGKKLAYRIVRNPFLMCLVGPAVVFLVIQRFPYPGAKRRERLNVWLTNLGISVLVGGLVWAFGLWTFLMIQLPVTVVAGAAGVWLFYVQHQFPGVYWDRHAAWDPIRAALEGSSYYRLPAVLRWFTGNIGLHHVHHVRPRIPNYRLQQCHDETPALRAVAPITLWRSRRCLRLNLYDEPRRELVSFRALKAIPPADPAAFLDALHRRAP
jgi:omega-6 fatty acid desaturase (delta-12 desaturase)